MMLPTYNSSEYIEECIKSLKSQTYKDAELIVIDDSSKDDTAKKLKKLKIKLLKNKKNMGCTKTINKGINISKGEFIFRLDHDMVYDKDCLKEMVKVMESDSSIGIVGCKSYYYKEKNRIRALGVKINLLTSKTKRIAGDETDNNQFNNLYEVDSITGGNMLIRRDIFKKTGLFNDSYFIYYSDLDLCLQAKKYGYKTVLAVKAKEWHKKEEKDKLSLFSIKYIMHDKIIFMKRNSPYYFPFLFVFLTIYTPISLIKYLVLNKRGFIKVHLSGILLGLKSARTIGR